MKRNQSGFTLIEIAIVLVIIGLLLGGVLKGQELINSARVKNMATDFRNIPVFIYGYQDKFKAMPGDDANAVAHLGATACAAPCAAGNGDGSIGASAPNGWNSTTVSDETQQFWIHVRLAGLAPGATSGQTDYRPINSTGGFIGIQSNGSGTNAFTSINGCTSCGAGGAAVASPGSPMTGTYVICSRGILGKFVKQLDITMDDGNTDTGSMRAILDPGAGATPAGQSSVATSAIADGQSYIVCMGV